MSRRTLIAIIIIIIFAGFHIATKRCHKAGQVIVKSTPCRVDIST